MRYWSDDTKQMLLTTAQTASGSKNFSDSATFSSSVTVGGSFILSSGSSADYGAGSSSLANARAAQDSAANKTRILVEPTSTGTDDYYSFSGLVDGQVLFVHNVEGCVDALIDGDPISQSETDTRAVSLGEIVTFVYDNGKLHAG
jgi:hypothetical protein